MKHKLESYLVRIYRRESLTTGIAGTVEIIGKEKTMAFRSSAEMLEIMKIRPLSDEVSDNIKRPGKTVKSRRINQKQTNRRKK